MGKTAFDKNIANSYHEDAHLIEGAAEISAHYWGRTAWASGTKLETIAPNRFRWAQEWLTRKYNF